MYYERVDIIAKVQNNNNLYKIILAENKVKVVIKMQFFLLQRTQKLLQYRYLFG
jgi:hypothetical protein